MKIISTSIQFYMLTLLQKLLPVIIIVLPIIISSGKYAKNFTIGLFKKASYRIACVIYTEWIDGGGSTSGISENKNDLPSGFNLSQNYPNPFNPTTKIKYTIPNVIASVTKQTQLVTLIVYDLLGKEVSILVNEEEAAGTYEVEFSAKGGSASGGNAYSLPSGIYFYKLQAGSFVETRKMVLMK